MFALASLKLRSISTHLAAYSGGLFALLGVVIALRSSVTSGQRKRGAYHSILNCVLNK